MSISAGDMAAGLSVMLCSCVAPCETGCPTGYSCSEDGFCQPLGRSCACEPGDTFDLACALTDPEGNRCPGAATCNDGLLSECVAPEDVCDETDNDCDGLVDEDPAGAQAALPDTWTRSTFSYNAPAMTMAQRRSLAFRWDETASMYVAESAQGEVITAIASQRRFAPSDWLRPIRLDAMRNIVRLTEDRFLSGVFGSLDATGTNRWGYGRVGTAHGTDTGYGQIADGNIFSAQSVTNRSNASNYFVHFRAMVSVNLIRLRPRPDFPDRTPASFRILYAGDKEQHFQQRFYQG